MLLMMHACAVPMQLHHKRALQMLKLCMLACMLQLTQNELKHCIRGQACARGFLVYGVDVAMGFGQHLALGEEWGQGVSSSLGTSS